ncbi:hypothetical protein ACFQGL_25860, partial [Micromonospora vulcania]
MTGERVGHRRRVARAGHRRVVGFGGAAASTGGRAGTVSRTPADRLRRPGVDRTRATSGDTRVAVDGGVGSWAFGDRRYGNGRRDVEPGRAGCGGPRRVGRRAGGAPTGGPVVGGQRPAGLGGLRAGSAGRRHGVRPAQRRHRVRPTGAPRAAARRDPRGRWAGG